MKSLEDGTSPLPLFSVSFTRTLISGPRRVSPRIHNEGVLKVPRFHVPESRLGTEMRKMIITSSVSHFVTRHQSSVSFGTIVTQNPS